MKRIISSSKISHKLSTAFLVAAFIISSLYLLCTKINVPSDMLSLLPKEQHQPLKQKAFDYVSREAAQRIIVLFGNVDRQKAYQAADFFNQNITKETKEKIRAEINFHINSTVKKDDLIALYFPYHNQILSPKYFDLLHNQQGEKIQKDAYSSLYSPVGMNVSSFIKDDPFLLTNNFLMNLPFLQSALFPYQDALMAKYDEKYYAFLTITLPKDEVFSTTELIKNIDAIKASQKITNTEFPDTEIILSGIPIHSHTGTKLGIKEINSIGLLSFFGILLLIYFNFRSTKPFFFTTTSILVGFVVGFAATHLVFGSVHMLTIIFGTSLVGVSDDYAVHFFCEYLNRKSKTDEDGKMVLKHIFPGITLGLITSILGYMVLIFTPFPGLQQIAFFSTIGFTTSYAIVVLFFPKFYKPSNLKFKPPLFNFAQNIWRFICKIISVKRALYLTIFILAISASGLYKMHFNDDIRLLYSSPKKLMDNEILSHKILQQTKAVQFFLIEAQSEQELLEKEESFLPNLNQLITAKSLISYQAISQIIPSIKKQNENRELIKNELMTPYLKSQAQFMGLNNQQIAAIKNNFEQKNPQYLTPKEAFANDSLKMLKPLWIGQIDNSYASIILLDGVTNVAPFKDLNQEKNGIYFMDKVEDISNIFKEYRTISFILLVLVHILIALLLLYRYGKKFIFVFLPPTLASILTLSIMGALGYPINLFNILALFLVLGVGVDYAIFYAEDKNDTPTTSLAVALATITTLLSFGLLSFSSFAVIHSFGVTILLGILFSYLLSPLATLVNQK